MFTNPASSLVLSRDSLQYPGPAAGQPGYLAPLLAVLGIHVGRFLVWKSVSINLRPAALPLRITSCQGVGCGWQCGPGEVLAHQLHILWVRAKTA